MILLKIKSPFSNGLFLAYSLLSTLFMVLLHSSCSNEIDYQSPEIKRRLVVYSIMQVNNDLGIYVGRTQSLKDKDVAFVSDALVTIVDQTTNVCDTAILTDQDGVYVSNLPLKEGHHYSLCVEAPGFDAVYASDYIPAKVEISSATFQDPFEYSSSDALFMGLLTLKFQDNVAEKNYYELLPVRRGTGSSGEVVYSRIRPFRISNEIVSVDSEAQNSPQSILFDDHLCNGKELVLQIKIQSGGAPFIFLRNVSETYYHYQKSLYTHLYTQPENGDLMFPVEPLGLFSNIKNGFGVFSSFNQSGFQSTSK